MVLTANITSAITITATEDPERQVEFEHDMVYYKVMNEIYKESKSGKTEIEFGVKGYQLDEEILNSLLKLRNGCTSELYANVSVKNTSKGSIVKANTKKWDIFENSAELDAEIDKLISEANKFTSIRDKLGYINDKIAETCKYDYNQENELRGSAQEALVDKLAVCSGFTDAVFEICKKLGIPCLKLSSSQIIHAYNLIYIEGQWYFWDLTWNVCYYDSYGQEDCIYYPKYLDDGSFEFVEGPAIRKYFLVPLSGQANKIMQEHEKRTVSEIIQTEVDLAMVYPELSKLDLELGSLRVQTDEIFVPTPTPTPLPTPTPIPKYDTQDQSEIIQLGPNGIVSIL